MNGADQKLVNFFARVDFIAFLNAHYRACGYSDKSKFIRDAIREKLLLEKHVMPIELTLAPSRIGKGGKPTHAPKFSSDSKTSATAHQLAAEVERTFAKMKRPKV